MKAKRHILVALPVLLFAAAQSPAHETMTISDAVIDRELAERACASCRSNPIETGPGTLYLRRKAAR